jgi:hypothetical protein
MIRSDSMDDDREVWHEIQVTSVPKLRNKQAAVYQTANIAKCASTRCGAITRITPRAPACSAIRTCARCSGFPNIARATRSWERWRPATRWSERRGATQMGKRIEIYDTNEFWETYERIRKMDREQLAAWFEKRRPFFCLEDIERAVKEVLARERRTQQ